MSGIPFRSHLRQEETVSRPSGAAQRAICETSGVAALVIQIIGVPRTVLRCLGLSVGPG
jgi:hypothetical protein